MSTQPSPQLSPEDYLEWEAQSGVKHEYIHGQVSAMARASDAHVTLALNLATLLRPTVRQRGCPLYMSDMKVRLEQRNCFYYPDLLVTCDPRDQQTPLYKSFPCLVIEVLSPSTEAFLWVWQAYSPPEDWVEFKSIGWQGHISGIYEDVSLEL
ncbi:Uma2 family endonuclease [uncultured Thermosynechococcus sp.]|uniref:Uma2 family endonuclease n=1 Tax=uncultured Thermosynechococcus sp. TaxID=436945 RepID=UPI0026223EF9|nr:Uma2 family endonuclease [uncultured Thermosynechococcus sp.]